MKILSFLALFISKIKTADIFNFLSVKYFGKGLLFLKTWHIRVNYCWNYGPSNLLFRFFRYRLAHLNNKNSRKLDNTFFWKLTPKQVLLKISSSLIHPPQSDGPLNFLRNWTDNHILMTNFSKLRKYQTFVLIELHNLSKVQLADRILKLWKSCVYDYRVVEHTFFFNSAFCFLNFAKWEKYESLNFAGISKMYCCWLF